MKVGEEMRRPAFETLISSQPRRFPDLGEVWRNRRLAVLLAVRNIKARYAQTVFGGVWLVVQPLLLTGVLTLVLGVFLSVPSGGMPYALFALTGTALWSTFQRALTESSMSLVASGSIIAKVYFPRILVPTSAVLIASFDFLPICGVVILASLFYGLFPGWPIALMPLFVLMALALALACGIWITVLDAVSRDLRVVVPSLLQIVFYASPVVYSMEVVPDKWRTLYHLNPLIGILQGFRWSTIHGAPAPLFADIIWSTAFAAVTLVAGLALFARLESFAVDRI